MFLFGKTIKATVSVSRLILLGIVIRQNSLSIKSLIQSSVSMYHTGLTRFANNFDIITKYFFILRNYMTGLVKNLQSPSEYGFPRPQDAMQVENKS
jgi:hypothetical protein